MSDCVAVLSGGLDSTTLVYGLVEYGSKPLCLSFDYGQRHKKELDYAYQTAERLGLDYSRVDLSNVQDLLAGGGSVLVDHNQDVPKGHYASDNMAKTVVPNRNMIMLSIASGIAVANDHEFVAIGVHSGDHAVYSDCREEFISSFEQAVLDGNEGFVRDTFHIHAPFLNVSKADIAYKALELGVPLHKTWSCYEGGDIHCGRCGTCVERLEAIDEAHRRFGIENQWKDFKDQTVYADTTFWREAVGTPK